MDEEKVCIASKHAMQTVKPYILMILSPVVGVLFAIAVAWLLF